MRSDNQNHRTHGGGVRSSGVSLDTYAANNSYVGSGANQSAGTKHVETHAARRNAGAQGGNSGRKKGLYVPGNQRQRAAAQPGAESRPASGAQRPGKKGPGGGNGIKLLLIVLALLAVGIGAYCIRQKGIKPAAKPEQNQTQNTAEDGDLLDITTDEEAGLSEEGKKLLGIRKSLESGKSVIETLRRFYPEYLIAYHSNGYVFEPIDSSIKKHSFKAEEVEVGPDGYWKYIRNGEEISELGIDVSSHQGDIDWARVHSAGISFAYIRALYRGYESGKLVEDKCFRQNFEGAAANGIRVGTYIFTQAISEAEVDEEIALMKELATPERLDLPVVVDVEEADAGRGRMDQLSREERTRLVKYYCSALKDAGYTPMLYLNLKTALIMLDVKELQGIEVWFADYDTDFYYPYDYTVWQYSDDGRVDGIDGHVDLDLSFRKK